MKDDKQLRLTQNYFTKTALVIANARLIPEDLPSSQRSTNRWFNLELASVDSLQEKLKPWRPSTEGELPPPMVIECFLDSSKLTPSQRIVLPGSSLETSQEIVLERWVVQCELPDELEDQLTSKESKDDDFSRQSKPRSPELPVVYKRGISSMRSLYTMARLLPAWSLRQRLVKQRLSHIPLKIGIRINQGSLLDMSSNGLDLSDQLQGDSYSISRLSIEPIDTPVGKLTLSASFRNEVECQVVDKNRKEESIADQLLDFSLKPTTSTGTTYSLQTNHSSSSKIASGKQMQTQPPHHHQHKETTPTPPTHKPVLVFTKPFNDVVPRSLPSDVSLSSRISARRSSSNAQMREAQLRGMQSSHRLSTLSNASIQSNLSSASITSTQSHHSHAPGTSPNSYSPRDAIHMQNQNQNQIQNQNLNQNQNPAAVQAELSDFVSYLNETQIRVSSSLSISTPTSSNNSNPIDRLDKFKKMQSSNFELSNTITRNSRRRSSDLRSRLGFYNDAEETVDRTIVNGLTKVDR